MIIESIAPAGDSMFVRDDDGAMWLFDLTGWYPSSEGAMGEWLVQAAHQRFGLKVKSRGHAEAIAGRVFLSWRRRTAAVR